MENEDNRPFNTIHNIRVQTYDIDVAGIVSNIVYIRWLEELRTIFLERFYPLAELFTDGYLVVLKSTQIEYKHPIHLFDQVVGHIWLHELTRIRWSLAAEIRTNNALAATSKQTGVFIERATWKLTAIPEKLRVQLAK